MDQINVGSENISDITSRLQAIIESAVDGIIIIDEKGLIEFVNLSTCRIFGYDAEEMIGNNISMLMPSPYREEHDGYLHNYVSTGIKKIIGIGREIQGKKKEGFIFPFRLSVSEVKLQNKNIFSGIIHDLTEQKKAEEELMVLNRNLENIVSERTEKLSEVVNKLLSTNLQLNNEISERKSVEQALLATQKELRRIQQLLHININNLQEALKKEKELSVLKNRFVSMASHEFRTPLTSILSSASLADKYTQTEQQDKREKHYKKIKSAANILTGILDDFMSLSRLEEGKVEVNYEDVDFNTVFFEVNEEIYAVLKLGQKILLRLFPDKIVLKTDKKLFKMILSNLLTNASKYSDEGAEIKCIVSKNSDFFEIKIIDQGIGIPEEDISHLFDRFFRATNAANIKGTGLGLNITKRYVELLGGTINFESELGKGSTFKIRFQT